MRSLVKLNLRDWIKITKALAEVDKLLSDPKFTERVPGSEDSIRLQGILIEFLTVVGQLDTPETKERKRCKIN